MPIFTEIGQLVEQWEERATDCRRQAIQHANSRSHNSAMAAIFEAKAVELEDVVKQVREVLYGPVTATCRCGQPIEQTPAGNWKHRGKLPVRLSNHLARPA